MNTLDIIFSALLAYGLIKGLIKGFFVEIASLLALIIGTYGAIHFSFYAGELIETYVDWDQKYLNLTAFAITFIAIVIGISMLGKLLTKVADIAMLGWANKLLGGVFGFLKFALVLGVAVYFFDILNDSVELVDKQRLSESIIYNLLTTWMPELYPFVADQELPIV